MLANAPEFSSEFVSSLRLSILRGAPISDAQVLLLMKKFPNAHFVTGYGLSEITPVTLNEYNDTIEHITQTIGRPIEVIDVKIKDTEIFKYCPVGVTGEILVHGYIQFYWTSEGINHTRRRKFFMTRRRSIKTRCVNFC